MNILKCVPGRYAAILVLLILLVALGAPVAVAQSGPSDVVPMFGQKLPEGQCFAGVDPSMVLIEKLTKPGEFKIEISKEVFPSERQEVVVGFGDSFPKNHQEIIGSLDWGETVDSMVTHVDFGAETEAVVFAMSPNGYLDKSGLLCRVWGITVNEPHHIELKATNDDNTTFEVSLRKSEALSSGLKVMTHWALNDVVSGTITRPVTDFSWNCPKGPPHHCYTEVTFSAPREKVAFGFAAWYPESEMTGPARLVLGMDTWSPFGPCDSEEFEVTQTDSHNFTLVAKEGFDPRSHTGLTLSYDIKDSDVWGSAGLVSDWEWVRVGGKWQAELYFEYAPVGFLVLYSQNDFTNREGLICQAWGFEGGSEVETTVAPLEDSESYTVSTTLFAMDGALHYGLKAGERTDGSIWWQTMIGADWVCDDPVNDRAQCEVGSSMDVFTRELGVLTVSVNSDASKFLLGLGEWQRPLLNEIFLPLIQH